MPFEVWAYFEPFKKDNNKFGRCKVKVDNNGVESLCGAQISANGGNTTTMKNHLMWIHIISISTEKRKLESSQSATKFPPRNRMTLPEIVARAASVEGTSLNAIYSVANKCSVKQHGHTLPTSHETISTLLFEFFSLWAVDEYKNCFQS